jgi:hypothetical protein
LTAARAVRDPIALAQILTAIARRLAGDERDRVLLQALQAIRVIDDSWHRSPLITSLGTLIADSPTASLDRIWRELVECWTSRRREGVLVDLRAMLPVLVAHGGPDAVRETFEALEDVRRWWP